MRFAYAARQPTVERKNFFVRFTARLKPCPDTCFVGRNTRRKPCLIPTFRKERERTEHPAGAQRYAFFVRAEKRTAETLLIQISAATICLLRLLYGYRASGLGYPDVPVHRNDGYLVRAHRQRERREQLIVQDLRPLGTIHPQLQPLDSHRRVP